METEADEVTGKKRKKVNARRGYYSEVVTDLERQTDDDLYDGLEGAYKRTKLLWKVRTERHTPIISETVKPTRPSFLAPAERWMCYEEEKQIVLYLLQILPILYF